MRTNHPHLPGETRFFLRSAERAESKSESGASETTEPDAEAPSEGAGTPDAGGGGLALSVQQIDVENATVVMRTTASDGKESVVRLEGLTFRARELGFDPNIEPSLHRFAAAGTLEVDTIAIDDTTLRNATGSFALAEGRVEVKDLGVDFDAGQFAGNADMDLNPTPFTHRASVGADPIDLNKLVEAREDGFGDGNLNFDATGAGSDLTTLSGQGALHLGSGRIPSAPMFDGIDKALGSSSITGAPYEATDMRFSISNGVLVFEPFLLSGERMRMGFDGRVSLVGANELHLAVSVDTPREGIQIEGVGDSVLDLLADDEGWIAVPLSITGTAESPKVRPNTRALRRVLRGGSLDRAEPARPSLANHARRRRHAHDPRHHDRQGATASCKFSCPLTRVLR